MSASGPHDAIAPGALPAIEALESIQGDASDFARAEGELRRLVWRVDWTRSAGPVLMLPAIIAFPLYGPSPGFALLVAAAVAMALLEMWRARTPRARAIKRIRKALADWLAFSPQAHDA